MRTLLCLLAVVGVSLASQCPTGSIYVDTFKKCYTFRAGFVAFSQAEAECNALGGNLVSVGSAFEKASLTTQAAASFASVSGISDFWIGLSSQNGNWVWSNGNPVAYTNWANGNPTANGGGCVAADLKNGLWRNVDCAAQKAYICAVAPNTQCSDPSTILNVPAPVQISPQDPKYQVYANSAKYFKASINMSADPCNDFYAYACGNYNKPISFYFADDNNAAAMAKQIEKPMYTNTPSTALAKTIKFYNNCKTTKANYASAIKDGKVVLNALGKFMSATGLSFSYIYNQGSTQKVPFTPQTLGKALGLLSAQGVDTLISPMVDTNWTSPSVYKFFVDQNTLTYPKSYYTPTAWPVTQPGFVQNTIALFNQLAALVKVNLDQTTLKANVLSLLNFEKTLAQTYSTDDTTRRHYLRSSNYYFVSSANAAFPFVDFNSYLQNLGSSVPGLTTFFSSSSFNFIVMEPGKIAALSSAFGTFDSQLVANYFFYRLLVAYSEYLPAPASYKPEKILSEQPHVGRQRNIVRPRKDPFQRFDATASDLQKSCATETLDFMQYTNARFFVDYLYPDDASKQKIHKTAGALIGNILKSMQSMIDRLDWMDDATKVGAYEKISDLKKNIAYPPFVIDNAKLDAYYSKLVFASTDNYFDMRAKLDLFNFYLQYKILLNNTPVDRNDFLGPPGTVNAWYQPEMNSITFPAGILQEPYFDQDWPASVNYGAMGVVAGHELTHGFDDEGVQWNGVGKLSNWMTSASQKGFQNMANCVVNEYGGFCPLAGTGYNPKCINGQQTQGENIADNGGIHAAWLAYRNHVALNGPDPQLPDPTLQWFSHDQLFFLSFGQVWCQAPESAAAFYRQIMVDPHSPSIYRVFGTVQNFPAFRNAFNCPVGSNYGPKNFCPVWVPAQNP